jgi:PEP-CTERM motif
MHLEKLICRAFMCLGLFVSASGANAALIDNNAYTTDTTFGLDWLDLSATKGLSVSSALSSNSGWSYANDTQVSNLLSSFGISYAFTSGATTSLSATDTQANNFQALFGVTALLGRSASPVTIGNYFNSAVDHSTYLCISTGGCFPNSFTRDADFSSGSSTVGTFLVRESATPAVPEPVTIVLFGAGLAGAFAARRKKAA